MRVDWCVSSWFRIKNTHSHTHTEPGEPSREPPGSVRLVADKKKTSRHACAVRMYVCIEGKNSQARTGHQHTDAVPFSCGGSPPRAPRKDIELESRPVEAPRRAPRENTVSPIPG